MAERNKEEPPITLEIHHRFNAAKLLQTDINAWRECLHKRCRAKAACLGGPRGTCARTGGWPACTAEGYRRLKQTKRGQKWQRSARYDETSPRERSTEEFDMMIRQAQTLLMMKR